MKLELIFCSNFFQENLEDGDEVPLTGKKELKESFWNSKKFSVDSIQGLDDLKTKSFDETWITGQLKFVPCKTTHWQNTVALNLNKKAFLMFENSNLF